MNEVCFPIGLNIKEGAVLNMLCIKKTFDYHLEKRMLNKIYCKETKNMSLKNKKKKKSNKTKKSY